MNNAICTHTGKLFTPFDPVAADICIEDIAHTLSNICRFGGHTSDFYSVAQHSYEVSYVCDPADALAGLLHDASEAYLLDIPTPLKPLLGGYLDAEKRLQDMIYGKYGLSHTMPVSVIAADRAMLDRERAYLMPVIPEWPNNYSKKW